MSRTWQLRWYLLSALALILLLAGIWYSLDQGVALSAVGAGFALAGVITTDVLHARDVRRDREQREVLLKITRELSSKPEIDELFDFIAHATLRLVPRADKCVIHLLNDAGRRLYPRYSTQTDWERTHGMPIGKGVAGEVLEELRTRIIPDVLKEPSFLPLQSKPNLRSLMVAPLHVQGKLLGTLSINGRRRNAFSNYDEMLVNILATQASAALYQTRLYTDALRETRYVEAIVNNLSDGLLVLDAKGRVLRYNSSLAHLLGPDLPDLVGQIADPDSEHYALRRLAFLLGDGPQDARQGYERQVEIDEPIHAMLGVSVSPVSDQDGDQKQIVLIKDQTDAMDRIQEGENLLTAASRELQPRLESIRGYATLLKSHALRAGETEMLWTSHIQEQSARLMRLAEDLADLRLILNRKLELEPKPISISDTISDIVEELSQAIERKNLVVNVQCPPNLPDLLLDPLRIRHVLLYLFENAIHRAAPGGHLALKVEVSLQDLSLAFADDGRSVPAEARARIFQGIFRSNGAKPDDPMGTGLTLYISRRIIEAHGGDLWMPEDDKKHTRFQIIIPLE